jgi:four helix bundle protein
VSSKFRELLVWQRAKELAVATYQATEDFPQREVYGLTAQMRKSAVSVPSNIAEGQGRGSSGEFKNFLGIARGSLLELETQIEIASELGLLKKDASTQLLKKCAEVSFLANRLISSLPSKQRV